MPAAMRRTERTVNEIPYEYSRRVTDRHHELQDGHMHEGDAPAKGRNPDTSEQRSRQPAKGHPTAVAGKLAGLLIRAGSVVTTSSPFLPRPYDGRYVDKSGKANDGRLEVIYLVGRDLAGLQW